MTHTPCSVLFSILESLTRTLRCFLFHHAVCQHDSAVSEPAQMRRDREGAVRRFMAAAEALRTAPIFARCGAAAPAFPDRLGAMDLFEAFQGAAQAVQQLNEAVPAHAHSAEMRGVLSWPCPFAPYSSAPPKYPKAATSCAVLWRLWCSASCSVQREL